MGGKSKELTRPDTIRHARGGSSVRHTRRTQVLPQAEDTMGTLAHFCLLCGVVSRLAEGNIQDAPSSTVDEHGVQGDDCEFTRHFMY